MKASKPIFLSFIFLLIASSGLIYAQENLTIYLFRHAETIGEGSDRELSERGKQRAMDLVTVINQEKINGLYSTALNRTLQTIQPFAEKYELEIQNYHYRDLPGFAEELKTKTGVILVSGHSNTTPELVSLLTGEEIEPIEESEYDNLFIVKFVEGYYTLSRLRFPPFSGY